MSRSIFLSALLALLSVAAISCISNVRSQVHQPSQELPIATDPPAPPEEDADKLVRWSMMAGNDWIAGEENEAYLYVEVKTGNSGKERKRVPLNISLVLDRSGSMAGEKIAYAKKAAKFVIEQLDQDDIVSIVNYDDEIEVSSPSQKVRSKEHLKQLIDKLTDRGSTNMTGGMLEGYNQVQSTRRDGYVNRVLLLTDGLANVGITEPRKIKQLVDNKYREYGIALSTFGLGADYNEDMLTMLAETGRANYYYIDRADKIPDIFARELKGLLSVVAQNAVASISIPEGMRCEKVYGYPYEVKNGRVLVRFNDLYANDEKGFLVKFRKNRQLSSYAFHGGFSYTDAESFRKIEEQRSVSIKSTSDYKLVSKTKNKKVQEMIALFESTERFDAILADVDKGDFKAAKAKADEAVTVLKETQKYYSSAKLKAQEEQIAGYASSMDSISRMRVEEKSLYQKSNKEVNYKMRKMK
jgi:Ca-activated chloride channel homolog